MKKILLTESEKKTIISEREKLIKESFAKTFNSIKRIDENEVPSLETKEMEKQAFDFANSPEMGRLVDKIIANAKPEDIQQIKRAVGSVSEGMMNESDFSSFLNIAHKAQAGLNEGGEVSDLQNSIGKALSTFGVVNIMSMGMLPTLVGMAVDHFTGTNFLQMASDALGSGGAAAGLSVIGSLIGGGLLWRLGKAISGEEVTGDTPLFEMGMNDGEDYEKISREVEYGINPYEEESEMEDLPALASATGQYYENGRTHRHSVGVIMHRNGKFYKQYYNNGGYGDQEISKEEFLKELERLKSLDGTKTNGWPNTTLQYKEEF